MIEKTYRKVLSIAGSDSGGGAGIQADLKTISALGCYGMTAITAITAQNTRGVFGIHPVPAEMVAQQIEKVLEDLGAHAVKVGMLHSVEIIETVAGQLSKLEAANVVVDPVMVATSGDKLIEDNTIQVLKEVLFPLAKVITPNLDEAEILVDRPLRNREQLIEGAHELLQFGNEAVLLKGGHLEGEKVYDVLLVKGMEQPVVYENVKIDSQNVHGTGCTLSSAIASHLALGYELQEAVEKAREYIYQAILGGKDYKVGHGHGPLNHFVAPKPLK